MQTDVAETIFDIVKVLPETKQLKVLDFVSDLQNEDKSDLLDMLRAIETRGKTIPDEIWEEIPPDASVNHDHYLYGAKKK